MFFDGIWFKVRQDSKVFKKCAYSVLGVNSGGKKEIIGIWLSESESASFWTSVRGELKNLDPEEARRLIYTTKVVFT